MGGTLRRAAKHQHSAHPTTDHQRAVIRLPYYHRGAITVGKCRPLSDSEVESVKAHTPDVRDKCILVLLERTGYRANEVASLT